MTRSLATLSPSTLIHIQAIIATVIADVHGLQVRDDVGKGVAAWLCHSDVFLSVEVRVVNSRLIGYG